MNKVIHPDGYEEKLEVLKKQMQMLEYIAFTLNYIEEDTSLTKSAIKAFRKSFKNYPHNKFQL